MGFDGGSEWRIERGAFVGPQLRRILGQRKLRDLVERQRLASETEPQEFLALDERFHRVFAEAAGVAYAWRVIEDVKAQMDRVRFLTKLQHPQARLVEQHYAMVDAVAARDPARAEAAMRAHLRGILTDLPAIAEARADFFEAAG